MGKVDIGLKILGDLLVKGKLLAVVQGDSVNQFLKRSQQSGGGVPGLRGRFPGEFFNQGEARLALHQRDERALAFTADDGVTLPVAQAAFAGNHRRAFLDGNPAPELAAAVLAASVTFAVWFLRAQVRVKIAALSLAGIDIKVDPLGADPTPCSW